MKKMLISICLMCILGAVSSAQDTVRYGDPWYAFYPLPSLWDGSTYPNGNITSFCGNDSLFPEHCYIGYPNNNYTIYGIAMLLDTFPGPEWDMGVSLLRGMEYHTYTPTVNPGVVYDSATNHYFHDWTVHIDSLYPEDVATVGSGALVKKCMFEYFFDYDSTDGTHKSSQAVNCYEFYFDTPIKSTDYGQRQLGDTIFVGQRICNPANPDATTVRRLTPLTCNPSASANPVSYPYLYYVYTSTGEVNPNLVRFTNENIGLGNGYYYRGGIFPIIGLRCSVPRGLVLSADSLTAYWVTDTGAVQYELSICTDSIPADYGRFFDTYDDHLALPVFSPDSVYRIYLRKACDFGSYGTWSDWSDPLVVGGQPDPDPNPNPDPNEGIGAVEGLAFSVTPNPVQGLLILRHEAAEGTVSVADLQGRVLLSAPATQHTLDVSHLPQGVYIVTLATPSGSTSQRVVKL